MKLYTEEQVRKAINDGSLYSYINGDFEFKNSEDDIINALTPIQLPSDEEIFNNSIEIMEEWYGSGCEEEIDAYFRGAKWMINKIQGGNK
jgi:hypothetical protein